MMPAKRTHTWQQSAEQLRQKAPARSCRRRHNGTATETRTPNGGCQSRYTPRTKDVTRATEERGKGRRMPRTKIGTNNSTEGATAHLTAHSKHNHTAPRRLQRGRKQQVDANPPAEPQKGRSARKRGSKQSKTDGSWRQAIERWGVAGAKNPNESR